MTNLNIAPTKTTPQIEFNAATGDLEISGQSYPESAVDFYQPVMTWLAEFLKGETSLTLGFKLSYFNTSSSKCILNILRLLEKANAEGKKVEVNWHHNEADEQMQETGEEFAENMKLTFNVVAFK
ncbi:MAG: DUF1987 domain-containing protein [Rhizobacter sp.]|nr:DUF1987 domain-containing protein [Chlorobiales bacterium]